MAEFGVRERRRDGLWLIEWVGCDGRLVATCQVRREALDIAAKLNESGLAEKWYARAKTGLALKEAGK